MNTRLIAELLRLRYQLLWARTRTRNGKIVIFFAGYLLFVLIALLLSLGGIGAGVVAVRSGRAQFVAQIVLTSIFVQTLVTTVIGYTGGGFRRYLLLPVRPENILRTGNWASMFLGSLLIPVAALAWIVFGPVPFDGRMLFMLLCAAVTGLFTFHGLALWATLYGPRRGDYSQGLGNDLSLLGNIVLIGGILSFLFGTMALNKSAPGLLRPEHWQMMLLPLALSFLFYIFSLRAAGPIFMRKREVLMAVVEGRS